MGNIPTSFKVTWVAKDSRTGIDHSYSRAFSVQIDQDESLETRSHGYSLIPSNRVIPTLPGSNRVISTLPLRNQFSIFSQLSTRFFDTLDRLFPEFDTEFHNLVYIDGRGDRILVNYRSADDLQTIIGMNNGLPGPVIHLMIEKREKERSMNSAIGTRHLGSCVECGGNIIGILFKCFQCGPDYDICGLCATYGSHPQHIIVRLTKPNMDVKKVVKKLVPEKKTYSIPTLTIFYAFLMGMAIVIIPYGLKNSLF